MSARPLQAGEACAIILARAGSKGVPGKNVAHVGGRPCIAWTIEAAQRATRVGCVVVSTDDPRAHATANEMGARVVGRPAALATDTARIDDAARHAADHARCFSPESERDSFVILYANVPVRPAGLIDRAVALLHETGADSVQSYARVGKHHPWWMVRMGEHGTVAPWEGDTLNHGVYRRQDLPAAYIPDGGVIALTREALFGRCAGVRPGPHAFFGRDRRGIETEEGEVVDIDSPIDLVVADVLLRRKA
ncbi:MAG: acylneuraminate cytidylyltransferase family protein [Phycisphaeraceae bacterium]|nr:acylneuraminate cytidylyltransferase family protein [Phycisphaeraceae bacterium]